MIGNQANFFFDTIHNSLVLFIVPFVFCGCTLFSSSTFIDNFDCNELESVDFNFAFTKKMTVPNQYFEYISSDPYQIYLEPSEIEKYRSIVCDMLLRTKASSTDEELSMSLKLDLDTVNAQLSDISIRLYSIFFSFKKYKLSYHPETSSYHVVYRKGTHYIIPLGKGVVFAESSYYKDSGVDSIIVNIMNLVLKDRFSNDLLKRDVSFRNEPSYRLEICPQFRLVSINE